MKLKTLLWPPRWLPPGLLRRAVSRPAAFAQAKEQFFPVLLVYRTGAYAPNGVPSANGSSTT
jgi:branched-chain amino acid transport system substrate-binding protein